jgi:hypothetical protein
MGMSSYTVFLLWQIVRNRATKEKVKTGILSLKIPKVKNVHPLLDKRIFIGEIFGHISIESSKFEGRFNPIFERPVANFNGKSFLGYSLMMFYQKISRKKH